MATKILNMKLFGKKKKSVASSSKSDHIQQNQSDPIIEDLLKKDPSTWNAKQRRLVRRFQDRHDKTDNDHAQQSPDEPKEDKESGIDKIEGTHKTTDNTVDLLEGSSADKLVETTKAISVIEGLCADSSSSSNATDDDERSKARISQSAAEAEPRKDDADEKNNSSVKRSADQIEELCFNDNPATTVAAGDAMVINQDLQAKLDTLNSKQRRTLVREFQRTGDLGKLKAETEKLLKKSDTSAQEPPKKKRRREKIDWNSLPREERLRREEQRRKQEAAAKARELSNADDDMARTRKHKHPLNSERRRANRRKPKWLKRPLSSQD